MAYAENTSVPTARTRQEIEELVLNRYHGENFGSIVRNDGAAIVFDLKGRRIRFDVPLPARDDKEVTHRLDGRSKRYMPRTPIQAGAEWERLSRSRWRALLLMIKATLEAVEIGIVSFEDAMLPYTVLPNGATVAEQIGGDVAKAYLDHTMPTLALGSGKR